MSTFKEAFGFNLKLIRKSKDITQEKLCEMIDLHTRQLSKIETGGHFPSCKTIEKLCITLGLQPQELFNFEFDTEMHMTGTDGYYRAVKSGNVIYLQSSNGKEYKKFSVEDIDYFKNAKNFGQTITVQHIENGKPLNIMAYSPDGTVELVRDFNDKEYEANMKFMLDKARKVAKDREYADFIKTAFSALEDSKSLEKLELMITGMKLARKK